MIELIEAFTEGKNDINGDEIVINDSCIAILDGVTPKTIENYMSATQIKNFLEINNKPYTNVKDIINDINSLILKFNKVCKSECASTLTYYNDITKEIYVIGNAHIKINNITFSLQLEMDKVTSSYRALYNALMLQEGFTEQNLIDNDLGRKGIMPLLRKEKLMANTAGSAYSYSVLNGKDIPQELILTYKVNIGDTVILASDGYPLIFDSLDETESYFADYLKYDPLMIKEHQFTKGISLLNHHPDDRTYVKFRIVT